MRGGKKDGGVSGSRLCWKQRSDIRSSLFCPSSYVLEIRLMGSARSAAIRLSVGSLVPRHKTKGGMMMMRERNLRVCEESASCGNGFETSPFRLKIFRPKKRDL